MKSQQYLILPTPWATPSPITLPLNTTLIVLMPIDCSQRGTNLNSTPAITKHITVSFPLMNSAKQSRNHLTLQLARTTCIIRCSNIFQNLLYQLFFTPLTNAGAANAFLLSGNMQSFYQYQRLIKIKLTHAATAR